MLDKYNIMVIILIYSIYLLTKYLFRMNGYIYRKLGCNFEIYFEICIFKLF